VTIERYDKNITMAALADFMLLGHGQIGSFALASSKTDLFATAIGAHLDTICTTISQYEMPRLLRMNGRQPKVLPRLIHGDIETVDLAVLGTYVTTLAGVGVDFTSEEMQTHLLNQAGLPTTGAGEVSDVYQNQANPPDPYAQDPNAQDQQDSQAASEDIDPEDLASAAEYAEYPFYLDPDEAVFADEGD
jgi:phage gp29-like protein